jgi:hypothetical protein
LAHSTLLGDANDFTDSSSRCRTVAGTQILRQSHGGQQAHNGHHDHQFDQGEAGAGAADATLAQGLEEFELGFGFHGVFSGKGIVADFHTLAASSALANSASIPVSMLMTNH